MFVLFTYYVKRKRRRNLLRRFIKNFKFLDKWVINYGPKQEENEEFIPTFLNLKNISANPLFERNLGIFQALLSQAYVFYGPKCEWR
jgi:hypothetical protein